MKGGGGEKKEGGEDELFIADCSLKEGRKGMGGREMRIEGGIVRRRE